MEFEPAEELRAEIWTAGGKVQAEMYGNRLSYVRNVRIDGSYEIVTDEKGVTHYIVSGVDLVENDGICIYVTGECEPDYRILSIKPQRFLRLEVEKRCQ